MSAQAHTKSQASSSSRIEALRQKHAVLSQKIEESQKRPYSAEFYLKQLKKQKLIIKEEIEKMKHVS